MEQTDLSAAKLIGTNLTGAQAKGTIFLEADLTKADLRGASFPGAVLRQAKLDGALVEGADFRGALGLEAWQVCSTTGWQGAQFDPDVKAAVLQACGGRGNAQP
jgi:Pentapeptide repeats (8 copies)